MKRILTIPITHDILSWFNKKQMFVLQQDTPYTPEEIAGSASTRVKEGMLVNPAFLQLWPCAIISRGDKIYTYWDKSEKPCHLWIGNNMYIEDMKYGNDAVIGSLYRILEEYARTPYKKICPQFIGYLCTKHDTKQNAFGMLYFVKIPYFSIATNKYVETKWMTIADLKKVYRKLDSWSKRIFDYIYEHPNVRKKMNLYQNVRKKSKKTD